MNITLYGSIPSKKNSKRIVCRGTRPILLSSEKYLDWEVEQLFKIKSSRPAMPYRQCIMSIRYWGKDNRKTDMDNKNASILDLLVKAEYLLDDNWFVVRRLDAEFMGVDKSNPRAEVSIN